MGRHKKEVAAAETQEQHIDGVLPAKSEKTMVKEAEDRWQERVAAFRQWRRRMAGDVLDYRYQVGQFAVEVMEDKANTPGQRYYGAHVVKDICAALDESESTVNSCVKFAKRVSAAELEDLKKHEWPWRAVASLITVDDAATYKELKDRFESGKFQNTDDFKQLVADVNVEAKEAKQRDDGGDADDDSGTHKHKVTGGATTVSIVKSFNTLITQATVKLIPELLKAVQEFTDNVTDMAPVTAETIASGLKDSRKLISVLRNMLNDTEEAIAKLGVD